MQIQWRGCPPKTRPSPMYYHTEFGRSALKGAGINTGTPQKPLSWDGRRG